MGPIGDDVVFGAGVKRTDRNHARPAWRKFARNERLQCEDDLATDHDGILSGIRVGPMGADAMNDNVDSVRACERAVIDVDLARDIQRIDVKCERIIRLTESLPDLVLTHHPCAQTAFFGRLHEEHQGAAPVVPARRHLPGRADQARDMHVVPAGVHGKDFVPGDRVDLRLTRSVLETRLLLDRQAVHVRTHHDERTIAILHHCDNAGAADVFSDLEASRTQLRGHARRGVMFDQ